MQFLLAGAGTPPRSDSEPGRYTQKARTCSLSTRALLVPIFCHFKF